jgi:secreted trypsin-like serine protease
MVQLLKPSTITVFLAACLLLTTGDQARSLTGGKNVGSDDIGAKTSVALYYRGKPFCGGVVFQDRFILTAAHCLTNGRGKIAKAAKEIEVRYWSSQKPRQDAGKVEKFVIHEDLLGQERASYPSAQAGDFINFPINHEDIAILKLNPPAQ